MVARAQVLYRAATIWPTESVPYSMVTIHQPDGYRQDCSGFASLCWAIPPGRDGGENTASLVTEGWMYEIARGDLQAGDAVGLCGPNTLGATGHIQIFEAWTATGLIIWEQAGGTMGPRRRTIKSITAGYKAYRYKDITEIQPVPTPEPSPPEEDEDMGKITPLGVYQTSGLEHDGIYYAWVSDGTVYYADTVVGPTLFPTLAKAGFDTNVIYLPKGVTMANVGKPAGSA